MISNVIRRSPKPYGTARAGLIAAAVCAAAAAFAAGPPAVGAPASPAIRPASTDVRIFSPIAGTKLAPGLTATRPVSGQCFAASLASQGRPDAWRCTAGNAILDPCFETQPPGGPLACATSPWSSEVRLLSLAEPVPQSQANHGDQPLIAQMPWAVELADGSRCTFLTGATMAVAGMRLNYGCAGGASVIGDVHRGGPVWRVFERPAAGAIIREVDVLVAWY